MKPASDTNIPEGTVMDLRSARHLAPFSGEIKNAELGRKDCGERKASIYQKKKNILSLTDHLQNGGGHQVAIAIPDFIQPIVP